MRLELKDGQVIPAKLVWEGPEIVGLVDHLGSAMLFRFASTESPDMHMFDVWSLILGILGIKLSTEYGGDVPNLSGVQTLELESRPIIG